LPASSPTIEAGRAAGLGNPDPGRSTDPAWKVGGADEVTLPVYHHWRFRTRRNGDFETLASRLHGVVPDASVGARRVRVHASASRFPDGTEFEPTTLRVGTAIASEMAPGPLSPLSNADPLRAAAISSSLKRLVNLGHAKGRDGKLRRVVGPPLYGRWHAQKASIDDDPQNPAIVASQDTPWLAELNADPEMRLAAGLGVRVVQQDQEALMAEAWRQLQAVAEANRRARWALAFQAAAAPLHRKRVAARSPSEAIRFAAPALGRLRSEGETVAAGIRRTALPPTVLGAGFGRMARFAVRALARSTPAEATLAPARLFDRAVPAMLEGARDDVPPRFAAPERISPARFEQFFAEPELRARVAEALGGITIEAGIERIEGLAQTITEVRDRIVVAPEVRADILLQQEPEGQAEPQVAQGGAGMLFVRRDTARARYVVVEDAPRAGTGVQIVIQAEGPTYADLTRRANDVMEPAVTGLVLRGSRRRGADIVALTAAEAAEMMPVDRERISFVVSEPQKRRLDRFLKAVMPGNAPNVRVMSERARIRSAIMTQFNHDIAVAPPAIIDEIADLEPVFAEVPPRITLAKQARAFPPVAQLDPEAVKATIVARLEPVTQYGRLLTWALPLETETVVGAPAAGRRRIQSWLRLFSRTRRSRGSGALTPGGCWAERSGCRRTR
jgi:hypothetical protein